MIESLRKINKTTIGKTGKYISKKDLTYEEFMAIKSDFSSFEFSLTAKGFSSFIFA